MKRLRPLLVLLAATLMAALGMVGPQITTANADVDVYVTPGYHTVNGREWHTTCGPYSTWVHRCTTNIWATQVTYADGRYTEKTGWLFNNLTYLGAPRSHWGSNPLANKGAWVAEDGRAWLTDCDSAITGRNGCRSYVTATIPQVVSMTPRVYGTLTVEVFNNMVRFSAEPPPVPQPEPLCNAAPLPSGYAMTPDGLPHSTKPPYTPIDLYNPTSVSNFIRVVYAKIAEMKRPTSTATAQQIKDQVCLAFTAGEKLIEGSRTQNYNGTTVRWYPYRFDFSANPALDELPGNPGWYSGLAQGGVLGALSQLHLLAIAEDPAGVGDDKWMDYGHETFESFMVPLDEGGITNREDGFLWFEEYPTTPEPTTVLNGHLEALIGLELWWGNSGEERAKDLLDEGIADLEPYLELSEVEVEGGLATSYDLVRGYEAGALRLRPVGPVTLGGATFNGDGITLPMSSGGTRGPNRIAHSDLNNIDYTGFDNGRKIVSHVWGVLNPGGNAGITRYGAGTDEARGIRVQTEAGSWRGVQQFLPVSGNFQPNEWLTLSFDSKLGFVDQTKGGIAGRVAVYSRCDVSGAPRTTLLYESQRTRSQQWDTYHHTFQAPNDPTCSIQVQLIEANTSSNNTYVWYDNVQLTTAESKGLPGTGHYQPVFGLPDNLRVFRTPVTEIGLRGSGTGVLQVHADGVWQDIQEVTLTPDFQTVVVPERYTGRNIHLAYHENHIDELISLCRRTDADFLAEYALRWQPMSPRANGMTIPTECTGGTPPNARARQMGGMDLREYDYLPPDPNTPLVLN